MPYKFTIDIDHYIKADASISPLMVADQLQHFVLTESPVVCKVPRNCSDWDIVWVGLRDLTRNLFGHYILVSPRFQEMLAKVEATGFEFNPTEMRLGFEHSPADREYQQLVVTGWGGIASEESGVRPIKSERGPFCYSPCSDPSKLLDHSQWDKSDFFRIWPVGMFVSDRIARVIREHRLKYVEMTSIERLRFSKPVDGTVGFIGKSLRQLYPESRARELGVPLGIY